MLGHSYLRHSVGSGVKNQIKQVVSGYEKYIYLHPRKLAWNPKIVGLLFQGCILRFHINLPRYRSTMIKRTNLNEDHQSDRLLCLKHLGGQGLLWDWEVSAGSNQPLSQALPINSGRFLTSMLRKSQDCPVKYTNHTLCCNHSVH